MALEYFAGDERPYWQPTIEVEGVTEDYSSGFTFEVNIAASTSSAPVVTKTSGITGAADGLIVVAWAVGELAITPGRYVIQLTATRTSDSRDFTIQDTIKIKSRLT